MIVKPARRRDPVRPAVLHDEGRALILDTGKHVDLDALNRRDAPRVRVFAPWDTVDRFAKAGQGELLCWGDDPIRWRHKRRGDSHRRKADVVVVKVPCDTAAAFQRGIAEWCDWLARYDTNPGWSLGGTSMGLLRSTLEQPLVTTNGQLPPPRWTLGGRQQSFLEPGTVVRGAVQLDLPAAYTHVIGNLRYGGAWRRLEPPWRLGLYHRAGYALLVRARVRLPDGLAVGPLHKRPRQRPDARIDQLAGTVPYPVEGTISGLWTYDELEQAAHAGASIRVTEAYVHAGSDQPFRPWLEAVMDGRRMHGFAGALAKATGNALWGQFVIDDHKRLAVQRWNGKKTSHPVHASKGRQKRAWDIGELVCGTVRARLHSALAQADPGDLIGCHTDGLWLRDSAHTDAIRTTLEADGWRVKSEAAELHHVDQQRYRYRLRRSRTFTVVAAGIPDYLKEDAFQELWQRVA